MDNLNLQRNLSQKQVILDRNRKAEGNLVDYAHQQAEEYIKECDKKRRKQRGQYFTPNTVARYMASLFDFNKRTVRLLDPGAGIGILTAAFCERLLSNKQMTSLTVDLYENDRALSSILENILDRCKKKMENNGHTLVYNIYTDDFIIKNKHYIKRDNLFQKLETQIKYDYIIANPPYFKLNKISPQADAMRNFVYGQPNIYALFLILSAHMLKRGGEMTFITPRSFCSGLYFKKPRQWLVKNINIKRIHIFESRKAVFANDKILQENIILKAATGGRKNKRILISSSKSSSFDRIHEKWMPYELIIQQRDKDVIIRIPTPSLPTKADYYIHTNSTTFNDLGYKVSTGPIVPFRARKYLISNSNRKQNTVPFIWMHNMQEGKIVWPYIKNGKSSFFIHNEKTKSLVLPMKNYVLVKRFSSKEQKHRLYAAALLRSEFPHTYIGIENHINYIYKKQGDLSKYETIGIAALLNTDFYDQYFRLFSGSTQVNAVDISTLPCPSYEQLEGLGKEIYKGDISGKNDAVKHILASMLQTDREIHNKRKK